MTTSSDDIEKMADSFFGLKVTQEVDTSAVPLPSTSYVNVMYNGRKLILIIVCLVTV